MGTVYVDRRNLELRTRDGVLELHEPTGKRGSVPLAQTDRVVLRGAVRFSSSVLGDLAEADVGVLALSGRHSRRLAILVGRPHNDVQRRIRQFEAYGDPDSRVAWSRALISAKVDAQERLLRRALERPHHRGRVLTRVVARIKGIQAQLSERRSPTIPELLGCEGAAAAAYFRGFATLFPPSLEFAGRNRRPPRDPVNACLSLGYTLLHFDAVCEIHAAGLDPLLGLLHEPAYGRESLASDIIEPLRPHVDQWVWERFRDRTFTATGFRRHGKAVLLGKDCRRRFYEHHAPLARALRRLLRRQARYTVQWLQDGEGSASSGQASRDDAA